MWHLNCDLREQASEKRGQSVPGRRQKCVQRPETKRMLALEDLRENCCHTLGTNGGINRRKNS